MSEQWTAQQYREHMERQNRRKSKMRNRGMWTQDGWFASQAEYRVWLDRKAESMSRRPRIRNLRRQVRYKLSGGGVHFETYIADIVYEEDWELTGDWREVVEDVKGYVTATFKRKRRLMRELHGIEIRVTKVRQR